MNVVHHYEHISSYYCDLRNISQNNQLEIEQNFDNNTLFYQKNKRLKKIKDTSNNFFKKNSENFDLIYVDGDKQPHLMVELNKIITHLLNKLSRREIDDKTINISKFML